MPRTAEDVIRDIREHPERHRHDFAGLQACCMLNGALHLSIAEAHEQYASMGTNGGQRCDVTRGPCSCGAWH